MWPYNLECCCYVLCTLNCSVSQSAYLHNVCLCYIYTLYTEVLCIYPLQCVPFIRSTIFLNDFISEVAHTRTHVEVDGMDSGEIGPMLRTQTENMDSNSRAIVLTSLACIVAYMHVSTREYVCPCVRAPVPCSGKQMREHLRVLYTQCQKVPIFITSQNSKPKTCVSTCTLYIRRIFIYGGTHFVETCTQSKKRLGAEENETEREVYRNVSCK